MSEATGGDLASEIRRLADIEAIKQLKAKYIRLVDGKQWDEWRTLFADDCRLETEGGGLDGIDAIFASITRSLADGTTIHRATMPEISITGPDTASAIWAMQDVVGLRHRGTEHRFRGFGYYHEDYVRTGDGWRIKRSKLLRGLKIAGFGEGA